MLQQLALPAEVALVDYLFLAAGLAQLEQGNVLGQAVALPLVARLLPTVGASSELDPAVTFGAIVSLVHRSRAQGGQDRRVDGEPVVVLIDGKLLRRVLSVGGFAVFGESVFDVDCIVVLAVKVAGDLLRLLAYCSVFLTK